MPRPKRTSRILEKAELRSAGLKAIDSNLDFGENCDLQNLTQLIEQFRILLNAYNIDIAMIDYSKTKIDEMEKTLSNLTDKFRTYASYITTTRNLDVSAMFST